MCRWRCRNALIMEQHDKQPGSGPRGFDPRAWSGFENFNQAQMILDHNRLLINEIKANHDSRLPEGLSRNVTLIRELNSNLNQVRARSLPWFVFRAHVDWKYRGHGPCNSNTFKSLHVSYYAFVFVQIVELYADMSSNFVNTFGSKDSSRWCLPSWGRLSRSFIARLFVTYARLLLSISSLVSSHTAR